MVKNAEVERMGRSRQHEYVPPGMENKIGFLVKASGWIGEDRR